MRRLSLVLPILAVVCLQLSSRAAVQNGPLTIRSAAPSGELGQPSDGNEIRITFAEPMIPLGGAGVTTRPSWITVAPAINASYYWSGTQTLLVSTDVASPLPYSTRYTVTIDRTAASVTGRSLAGPYTFSFTTPTPRLLSAQSYRKTGRYDSPIVLALRFNQPMRAADVLAHARVSLTPHQWTTPTMSASAVAQLAREDPAGLRRFYEKVAAAESVAASSDVVPTAVADGWNEERFPRAPNLVVLETTRVPPTDAWLTVAVDDRLPGAEGAETHAAQSSVVRLEPTFFVNGPSCTARCNSSGYAGLNLRASVTPSAIVETLSVRDVTSGRTAPIPRTPNPALRDETYPRNSFDLPGLGFPRQPGASTWEFRIAPTLTAADGQTLGYPWIGQVETTNDVPAWDLGGSVWEAGNGPVVPVYAQNILSMSQQFMAIDASQVIGRIAALNGRVVPTVDAPPSVRQLIFRPNVVQAHPMDLRSILSPAGTGLVMARLDEANVLTPNARTVQNGLVVAPGPRALLLQVTNLGLTVKDSPQSTLVFVTRLDTAAPVPAAKVRIVDSANRDVWRGVTGRDGVALAPALALRVTTNRPGPPFVVIAEKDADVAYAEANWHRGIEPWRSNYRVDQQARRAIRGSVFTDRGVYKQGDLIHIKAVMRADAPEGARLLEPNTRLEARVRDSRGTVVVRRTVTVGALGSADWEWSVPAAAALGYYAVSFGSPENATSGDRGEANGNFLVAAYRPPDFRVDTTMTGEPAVLGTTFQGTIDAKYLFGSPLGTRPTRWWATRVPYLRTPKAILDRYPSERFTFGYMPERPPNTPYEERLVERTETLDASGRLRVTVPSTTGPDSAFMYVLNGDVEGVSGQHIANGASLVVHPASIYVGVRRPPMFVDTSVGARVEVVAANLDGTVASGVPVTVSLFRLEWSAQRRPGQPDATWTRREVAAGQWTVTTSGTAAPLLVPVATAGSYALHAEARDAQGRPTRTDLTFYAFGRGRATWKADGNRIDLVSERQTWNPGESARIMIQSPWDRATALVTLEREGVRSHRQFAIASTQDVIELPITEADVPNVFVSVLLVKGRTSTEIDAEGNDPGAPDFRLGYTQLTVDRASRRLQVSVATDREEYRPRAQANVSVAVTDSRQQPVESEITLWAVDYGLLSLTDYSLPDVAAAIYAARPLQVITQESRTRLIHRATLQLTTTGGVVGGIAAEMPAPPAMPSFRGGVGGGRGGAGAQNVMLDGISAMSGERSAMTSMSESVEIQGDTDVRTDFRPVVFWLASLPTDARGRAATTVTLPDSLTTYRIMAVAGDRASRFGMGDREIHASKPLTLLPAFPRFMTVQDRASFSAVVTSTGTIAGNAVVTVTSLDPSVLQFAESTSSFRMAAGASEPVTFPARALASGTARVRMRVDVGGTTDAFEMSLPVTIPTELETLAAYGDTTSTSSQQLVRPSGVLPGSPGLRVSLASTALVGLTESARYLDEYPYECAEQKASRALALILSADLDGAFNLGTTDPAEQRAAGTAALDELSAYQCGDGGYALWAGECRATSAYLTAYVLHVMKVADTLKVRVDRSAIDRALNYLRNQLRQAPPEAQWWPVWGTSQAYALKVLAEFGQTNLDAEFTRLAGQADRLPVVALSYLADAFAAANRRGAPYQDLVRRLTNATRLDADRAFVEERDEAALVWLWNTNVRSTAVVLDGFARRKDQDALVAPLARWVLAARQNGRWAQTHENAMALEALVSYYRAFEAEVPDMTTSVTIGGRAAGTATFKGRSVQAQDVTVTMSALLQQLTSSSADLVIARQGTGRLYYTTRLQSLKVQPAEALDRGVRLTRRYEPFVNGEAGAATTTFSRGDVVRVTVTVQVPKETRFLAVNDALPAGFEPIEGWFATTASDLAREATVTNNGGDWLTRWRRGGFEHVEKHDDRVLAFATRLGAGRHEFSYLVRATTAGEFRVAGTRAEEMYAPEVTGRGVATSVVVK